MAFALALKSKFDFPGVGSMFLLITLIITAFTLIYSSFLLEDTLIKCEIIVSSEETQQENLDETPQIDNFFEQMKTKMHNFHLYYLLPYVERKVNLIDNTLKHNLMQDFRNN
jgi:hypothetical protein